MKDVFFYSIGYEKTDVERFFYTLADKRIEVLADIRAYPYSKIAGFSMDGLIESCKQYGIEYKGLSEFGMPRDGRILARNGNLEDAWDIYRRNFAALSYQKILDFKKLAEAKRVCVMCMERDYRKCHRHVFADLMSRSEEISCQHLKPLSGHPDEALLDFLNRGE